MDAIKCIYSRVSTRDFNTREVSDEDVNDIVRAAMAAPVGMGRYALKRITVMKNEEFLEKVTAACPQDPARRSSPFYGAKTVIIVSAETKETPDIEYADAACMVYAMALAARAKGIASVYLWCAPTKNFCLLSAYPKGILPFPLSPWDIRTSR